MSFPARLGLILTLLAGAAPSQDEDGDVFAVVDELLKADGLDRSALAIRDRKYLRSRPAHAAQFPDPQPHLLPAVRDALDRPLALPAVLEQRARRIWNDGSPAAIVHQFGEMQGAVAQRRSPPPRPALLTAPKGLSPETWKPVARLLQEIAVLEDAVEASLAALSEKERAHLRDWLPRWVTRTEPEEEEKLKKGDEDEQRRLALMRCGDLLARTEPGVLRIAWANFLAVVHAELGSLRAAKAPAKAGGKPLLHAGAALYGAGNNRIESGAKLVIDFGGNDEYRGPEKEPLLPVRVLIDLAGDDLYLARGPFSWGAALLGCSLHVDVAGDDDYRGRDWSLGCGAGGHGAVWDLGGRDRYYGGLGAQGVGLFGTGTLVDDAGDDEYAAGLFCQGFGSTGGAGAIVDRSGDDTYTAGRDEEDIWRRPGTYVTFAQGSAFGHRFGHVYKDDTGKRRWKITGQLPGGVGLVLDRSGNDRYEADVFGQGSAYWYGLGAIVDGGGNDRYRTTWYGQGVGTHAAVGAVVDAGGNDWYFSRNTSQGCGHDFSAGLLVDRAGDDEYAGLTLCQGAGNAGCGLGVLLDEAGDDRYRCGSRCWGFGSGARVEEVRPFGFLIDRGGTNSYTGWTKGAARTGTRWKHEPRGYGADGHGVGENGVDGR